MFKRHEEAEYWREEPALFGEAPLAEEDEAEARPSGFLRRLSGILLLAALVGALVLAWFVLRIEKITVVGNTALTTADIEKASGIEKGTHLWLVNLAGAADAIRQNPYIASVRLTRVYPDTIRITVEERQEAAAVIGISAVAIVDRDGYVLSIAERASYEGLLKVYGVGASGYQVNGRLGDETDFATRTMVSLIGALDAANMRDIIESVDISNALRVTMQTTAGYTVQLGQPDDLADKLKKLAIVLPEVQKLGYAAGAIDVSVRGDPVFSPPETQAPADTVDTADEEYTHIPSEQAAQGTENAGSDVQDGTKPEE